MKQTKQKSILVRLFLRSAILLIPLLFYSLFSAGQESTINDLPGDWEVGTTWEAAGNWDSGGAPTTAIDEEITINGDIYSDMTSLQFAISAGKALTIEASDTLTIDGDMTFTSAAFMTLEVKAGGVLKVLGDFTTDASAFVTIVGSGTIVVSGDLDLSAGSSYTDPTLPTPNNFIYIGGSDVNNAISVEKDFTDLQTDNLTLYNEVQSELPVVLLNFTARTNGQNVELGWATASEENFDFFEIQRSNDGISFEGIQRINGQGNSNQTVQYAYTDKSAIEGVSYYRLKAVDYDGTFEIFETARVNNFDGQRLIRLYPNPVRQAENNLKIDFREGFSPDQIEVLDASGKVLMHEKIANNLTGWQLNNTLSRGIYHLRIQTSDQILVKRFLVN